MYPALDLGGYKRRTDLPVEYVDQIETQTPGFFETKVRLAQSRIYSQLRKRYGKTLPFGGVPSLDAAGTSPPPVTLAALSPGGAPILGSLQILVAIVAAGAFGIATFQYSIDGQTWLPMPWPASENLLPSGPLPVSAPITTAASITLPSTGLALQFPPTGVFAADNAWSAPTPVPEAILGWLTAFLDYSIVRRRFDPSAPEAVLYIDDFKRAVAEVEQAANSRDGLFDLPAVDGQQATAVSTGGIQAYSESGSPFVSADRQERDARHEDERGFGTFSGSGFFGGP